MCCLSIFLCTFVVEIKTEAMRKLIGKDFDSFGSAEVAVRQWLMEEKKCYLGDIENRREYRHHATISIKTKPWKIYIFRKGLEGTDDFYKFNAYFFSTLSEAQEYAKSIAEKRKKVEMKRWKSDVAGPIPKEFLNKWHHDDVNEADGHEDGDVVSSKDKEDIIAFSNQIKDVPERKQLQRKGWAERTSGKNYKYKDERLAEAIGKVLRDWRDKAHNEATEWTVGKAIGDRYESVVRLEGGGGKVSSFVKYLWLIHKTDSRFDFWKELQSELGADFKEAMP
jgi:hypothetical protein